MYFAKSNKIKFVLTLCMAFALVTAFAFQANAAAESVKFYDENGVTLLATIPVVSADGGAYINWKQLNNVPDFNATGNVIILSWKKKGDATNTRVILSNHAARGVTPTSINPKLVMLTEDLELVPLLTMSRLAFSNLHYGNLLVDGHMDTPQRMIGGIATGNQSPVVNNDLANPNSTAQGSYRNMVAGGLTGGFFAAYTTRYDNEDWLRGAGERANSRILAVINATEWSAERNPSMVEVVRTPADFARVFAANRLSLMHTIEGAYSITEDNYFELAEQYLDLGVKVISFTHNPISYLATGINAYSATGGTNGVDTGMTNLGFSMLARLKALGIVYDISHASDKTVSDAIAHVGSWPIIGTHSGAWGEFANDRNVKDQDIVNIAKAGGVIMQNFYGSYMAEPRGVYEVVNMIDYTKTLLEKNGIADGTNHIGFGADYDGGTDTADINDASYYFRAVKELLARGYTEAQIKKIMNENIFRVLNTVQAGATPKITGGTPVTITNPTASGTALGMGTGLATLSTREPVFSATLGGVAVGSRVIIDGIVYPSSVSSNTLTANLSGKPLQEEFHVVTFEAKNAEGQLTRNTKIFRTDAAAVHKIEFMDTDGETVLNVAYVNNNGTIVSTSVPTTTTDGRTIDGWKIFGNNTDFVLTTAIARSYRLVATAQNFVITTASVSVTAPVNGEIPDYTATPGNPSKYTATVKWFSGGTASNPGAEMNPASSYVFGRTYIAQVSLKATAGNEFSASPLPTVTVNGRSTTNINPSPIADAITYNVSFTATVDIREELGCNFGFGAAIIFALLALLIAKKR